MEKSRIKEQLEKKFNELLALSDGYIDSPVALHEIEKGLLGQLLSIGLLLLRYIIGNKLRQCRAYEFDMDKQAACQAKGNKTRRYLSLFGWLSIKRPSHWVDGLGVVYKLVLCNISSYR